MRILVKAALSSRSCRRAEPRTRQWCRRPVVVLPRPWPTTSLLNMLLISNTEAACTSVHRRGERHLRLFAFGDWMKVKRQIHQTRLRQIVRGFYTKGNRRRDSKAIQSIPATRVVPATTSPVPLGSRTIRADCQSVLLSALSLGEP